MKVLRSLAVFTAIALNCFLIQAGPSAEKTAPIGYRLTVDLNDGSRVIGKSREEHFEFKSDSLGEMRLPLEKVRSVECMGKTNLARLMTAANDSLMVVFVMKDIRVETAFGEVKLPVAMIKSVRVSVTGGPGRPKDGLIGLWSGDGNAEDSVAGNHGRNENVNYVEGVADKAFSFSPGMGFMHRVCINIPDKPEYVLTRSLSIDAWIRPQHDAVAILTRGDRRPGYDPYSLSMDRQHGVTFQITDDNGESASVCAEGIPWGEWTHVTGTLDGDSGKICIYKNGVLAAEKETTIRPIGELIENLTPGVGIGNVNDGMNNFPFVGDIDEVALYNRALTAAEVKAIYTEHAATADGKVGTTSGRGQTNNRLHNGFKPKVDSN